MAIEHQLGGAKAKGFAALSRRKRMAMASSGGTACYVAYGHEHMQACGRNGARKRRAVENANAKRARR